jgi:hypothetical protein
MEYVMSIHHDSMVGSVEIHVMFIWAHSCEIKLVVGAMLAIGDFPKRSSTSWLYLCIFIDFLRE